MRERLRRNWLSVATLLLLLLAWEVAAHLVPPGYLRGSPLVPSWEYVFTDGLRSMSSHWPLDFLAPRPSHGGPQTYLGALLAIGYHSSFTLVRVVVGLVVGAVVGIALGLAVTWSPMLHQLTWTPINFLRMIPRPAAIPLFQLWFGATTLGALSIIAFSVAVLVVVTTMHAVISIPDGYVESARTLGASRLQTYRTVIIPGILPQLRTGLLIAGGLGWTIGAGAEYLGIREGLGKILILGVYFTNTGQMVIVAVLMIVYALISFAVLDLLLGRTVTWMPRLDQK